MQVTDKKEKPKKPATELPHVPLCSEILADLQKHEMATFFLYPVNLKEVPDYKKVIKKPMDFYTIETRLRKGK